MKNYHDGGEAIVEALRNLKVDYILSSPGSEWSPVWEAMARQKVEGAAGPTFIDCWHETLAVDMAMGYTAITGRPQAVMIHAGVGLMHGSMAVLSATQAELPMIVMSGESTTFGEDPEMPMEPQWYGGVSVGGAHRLIQPLVKWAGQVTHASNIHQAVVRAGEMAQRTPQGPVYLNMSLEAMMQPWEKSADLRPAAPAPKTQALPQDIEAVAALVRAAKNPVIVTEQSGRDPAAYDALVALAEAIGAPVICGRASTYTNFPRHHPLWLGYQTFEHLADADLVLLAGGKAPWYPAHKRPCKGQIVSIGENPVKHHLAYQNQHADLYLEGDMATALSQLAAAAHCDGAAVAARKTRWAGVHEALVARFDQAKAASLKAEGLDCIALAAVAAQMLPADTIYVDETITHMPQMRPYLPLDRAQSFFRVTGGALGQGIGAALGAKLAARDKPVALFVGDGSFLYNPIIQAFGAAKAYDLPILIVVCNNQRYEAMRKGHELYYPQGAAVSTNSHHGVFIAGPAYEDLGSHFGFFGAHANNLEELRAAFSGALAALAEGRSAILNVSLVK